ncbi:MAG: lysostaphin resistance A-like protein [Anaerolineales bacterium]
MRKLKLDPTWISSSPLLEMTRQARRLPHGGIVLLVALGLPFLASLGAAPLGIAFSFLISKRLFFPQELEIGFLLITSFGSLLLLVWLWIYLVERRPFVTLGFLAAPPFASYGGGFVRGLVLISLGLLWIWLLGVKVELQPLSAPFLRRLMLSFLFLPAWIVQGAAEEVLIRGWMLPVFSLRHGVKAGIFVSAVSFALLHILNPGLTRLALLNLALFGIFAALYALKEGNLWGICALHAAWNWSLSNLFGLSVSGMESDFSLLSLRIEGEQWLTGGTFGPEGGIVVTFLLLLAIGWLLVERK